MTHEISEKKSFVKTIVNLEVFYAITVTLILVAALSVQVQRVDAARFTLLVEEDVYIPGESLVIYGAGADNDLLVVRLFDPTGRAVKTDTILTDSDGLFRQTIYIWPEPSTTITFGEYLIEVSSSLDRNDMRRVEVRFAEAIEVQQGPRIPTSHTLGIKLDSPAQVSVNEPFRIFIQVTFDGALVKAEESETSELLGTSHVHFGNTTILLAENLKKLHEGLYFADVRLESEGAYVIHAVAFHRGLLSHDSKVISATLTSISTIQESVRELDARLDSTNRELAGLQQGIQETRMALNDTQDSITDSVKVAREGISDDIEAMQQATGQINSLILPVLALISVIIALQISLFARIRASFR